MSNMRKCPKCGKVENLYTYFCTECGTKTIEYSGERQVQQSQNRPIQNTIVEQKTEINSSIADNQDRSVVESIRDDVQTVNENMHQEERMFESQTMQTIDTKNIYNGQLTIKGSAKRNFQWNKKYTYACIGLGACLVVGLILSQILGGRSKSSQIYSAQEDLVDSNVYYNSNDVSNDDYNSDNYDSDGWNKTDDDELENQDTSDIDVESIVLDIREKYNSTVDSINADYYDSFTYPAGISAYYEGNSIRAIRVQKEVDDSPYARYYYYDDNGLFFAYYESDDAHRLYFDGEKLVRWRYSVDSKTPSEATNYDLGDDEEYSQIENAVLNDSSYFIQYVSNAEGFSASDYVLPGSDSRYIDKLELDNFSADECRLARNEIYARHGRMFTDEGLQSFFDSKEWYSGYISPDDWDENSLNEFEFHNRDVIVEYEKEMGYR